MSFASPLVLLALLAIPLLINLYLRHQRGRAKAAATFVAPQLSPSVAPVSPRWRRHVPIAAFGLAIVVLIVAAARPQRSVAVPVNNAAVVLANDVSSSMAATDLPPSRLVAAERAANHFISSVPSSAKLGLIQFNEKAAVLQSPTTDHAVVRSALSGLRAGGHTAIGDGINTALKMLASLPAQGGKRPPAAIVLLSDGYSTTGADPLAAARQARSRHVPIYTVVIGTQHGTITVPSRNGTRTVPAAAEPGQLQRIAQLSGGQEFTAANAGRLNSVYAHLAAQLSHKHVKREVTASFAGGGLVLLLLGSVASLLWFRRLV
jgi:Ca-activated chloride channel family protein